jgi:hypothetical protein
MSERDVCVGRRETIRTTLLTLVVGADANDLVAAPR